ncbi:MAG: hypothetical protein ACRD0U_18765, partial [Acidimicrobiales bacterium]
MRARAALPLRPTRGAAMAAAVSMDSTDTTPALEEWPLVGRDDELAFIDESLAGGAGVVLAADAGVGKTRLARAALSRAVGLGWATELVVATRSAMSVPLCALLGLMPDDVETAEGDRLGLFRRVREDLGVRARGRRLLLMVDDANLLDDCSAALVHFLVLTGAASVVVTVRVGESAPDAVTALWRDGLARRLDVQPLGRDEVGDLLGTVLGGPVDAASSYRLWGASGGNPMYLREVVRGALQAGTLHSSGGVWSWTGEVSVGPRLRDLLADRLGSLAGAERDVLDLLAVGEPLPRGVVEHLCPAAAVGSMERRGLVVCDTSAEPARLRLDDPVFAEVLRAELGRLDRQRLCRRLASAVDPAEPGVDVLRVAVWRIEAGVGCDPLLLTRAAVRANHLFDSVLAERLARAALEAGGGIEAVLALSVALNAQHAYGEADAFLAAAEESAGSDAELVAVAKVLTDTRFLGVGRPAQTEASLRRLEAKASSGATRRWLQAMRASVATNGGRIDGALALTTPWMFSPDGDGEARLQALISAGSALSLSGRPTQTLALCDELLPVALAHADELPREVGLVVFQRVVALYFAGRGDEAEKVMEVIYGVAVTDGDDEGHGLSALALGYIALDRGRLGEA